MLSVTIAVESNDMYTSITDKSLVYLIVNIQIATY